MEKYINNMDEEIEEKGISLGDIFRTIFSQKWLALIVAAAIFIVGTVGLYFYSKFKTEYSVTFVLRLPGAITPISYTYPDGTSFYYTDLISSEYLEEVKKSDETYADINTAEMLKQGDISIKRNYIEQENVTEAVVVETTYTIKVSAKYFTSGELARDFLIDIANLPCVYISKLDIDYDLYLSSAKEANRYDIELDFIERQVSYLQSAYSSYISSYGANFIVDGVKTLNSYNSALSVFIQNNTISNRRTEVTTNKYIKSQDAKNEYSIEVEGLKRQLEVEERTLDILKDLTTNDGSTTPIINSEVLNQARLVESLKQKIEIYSKYADEGVPSEEFAKSIIEIENKVDEFTNDFAKVASAVNAKNTSVSFSDANIMKEESGIGLVMIVAISFVLAIIIACVVAYIVGRVKLKKPAAPNAVQNEQTDEKQNQE
ncbi:MAG: hypothetical protein K2L12_02995 [Clostridia bacterium]|nr:hypothetical protein [Clostridia bacterium]